MGHRGHPELDKERGAEWLELMNGGDPIDKIKGPPGEQTKLSRNAGLQLGSLGGGNHFIEICRDQQGANQAWVMLHSGSRNIGKVLAERHIDKAKGLMKKVFHRTAR